MSEKRRRTSEVIKIEKHTEIFASMCPDEILDFYHDYDTRNYYTTLMLGDVSGFTELAEKYTNSGEGGPSKLTETLNNYIGPMIQEILSHHGDVLKFSGDAFIVMWKLRDGILMQDLATDAMQTACVIQKHYGTYETDVGVTLRVKLAIASGKIHFTSVGSPDTISHYIITGKPVWDVKAAEALCRGGEILVLPSSWEWANPNDYIFKTLADGVHTLIIDSVTAWDHPKGRYNNSDLDPDTSNDNSIILSPKISSPDISRHHQISSYFPYSEMDQFTVDYSLRPKVIYVAKRHLKNELRSYMLRPVMRSVELDEPLEHLTEIRQVVIVFVNIVTANIGNKRVVSLVAASYKLICGIVSEMQGCVNKTSLFDKDLMFLCIFGLRGDKHDFEAQIGLRCAVKLRRELTKIKNIKSVSIGVTSGMTYCGVVGHVLRREYTVIGMAVNRAARLMIAYKNKVICDKDTFLHSRFEAIHFILQEPKYLKGISNVGPVYEFSEYTKDPDDEIVVNPYPLLSRQVELKLFKLMVSDVMKNWKMRERGISCDNDFNVLIIRGEPRIGKTRLLDEMSLHVPREIACSHIGMVSNQRKTRFALIYLIFSGPLDFTSISTPKNREEKLNFHLENTYNKKYYCALNQVFNVDYKVDEEYSELSEDNKWRVLKKLVATLVHKCFESHCIVMIDDVHNADVDSLKLIDTIVNEDKLFFILTCGQNNLFHSNNHPNILKKSKVIDLLGLDKWFHAGLACQMLKVAAIPAELEKIIQEKSMGNPGWIESYLVSLIQVGGIEVKQVAKKKMKEIGLVAPPSIMIEARKLDELKLDENFEDVFDRSDGWQMYKATYESTPIQSRKSLLSIDNDGASKKYVAVCVIPRGSSLEEINPEIAMDVVIIKLFDSLSPSDQFLLKCAAVLGETVDRKMLEKLMEGTSHRDIALTVRNLFEMRILSCAAGDFSQNRGTVLFYGGLKSNDGEIKIRCACKGLEIHHLVADLPKYASCGLLRFKVETFRETTYRLLTENQKIELHRIALKYLKRTTKKCQSCGGGPFTKLLGQMSTETPRATRNPDEFDEILDENFKTKTAKKSEDKNNSDESSISSRNSDSPGIPKTFSYIDFTNCQCILILITAYTQILSHCWGIDRKDKVLTAILEFVEVLLTTSNIPYATKLLIDAEKILNKIYRSDPDELVTYLYLKGKIKTFKGRCHRHTGLIDESLKQLTEGIQSLGYKFPKHSGIVKLKGKILFEQKKIMFKYLRRYARIADDDDDAANYNDQLSKCLIQMFDIFQIKRMQSHARFAAVWALNAALKSNKDFQTLAVAYGNMIASAHNDQYHDIIQQLEADGLELCSKQQHMLDLQEMKAIVHLYTSIFFSRFLRGNIEDAYSIGLISRKFASTVKSITQEIFILARIIQMLIMKCQYDRVIILLQELRLLANDDIDKSGRTWYYGLCVDLQLEAGIIIETFEKCEHYYLEEGNTMIDLQDPEAERRYFTSMWLWCIRMDKWDAATIWKNRKASIVYPVNDLTVAASITALKNLEGHIIYFVRRAYKQVHKNPMKNVLKIIEQDFKMIDRQKNILKITLARYNLLKAYYHMAQLNLKKSMKYLNLAKIYSKKMGIQLIFNWAEHLEEAWNKKTNESSTKNWREACEKSGNAETIVLYTLPLPRS